MTGNITSLRGLDKDRLDDRRLSGEEPMNNSDDMLNSRSATFEYELDEDILKPPREINNFRIHFAALTASIAAMVIGYEAAFIGLAVSLTPFNDCFFDGDGTSSYAKQMKSNVISLFHVGAFFGSYFVYPFSIYLGALWSFKISGLLVVLGSGLQLGSNQHTGLTCMLVGRILAGIGIGAISNQLSLYIANISPTYLRATLTGNFEIMWQVGGILGFFINYGTEQNLTGNSQWQIPIAFQLVPAGIFFIGVFFLKEAPRWLFSKGRRDEGIKSLVYYRNLPSDHPYIKYEIESLDFEILKRKSELSSEFFSPFQILFGSSKLRFRLMLTLFLFVMQNTSGINAIMYYSVSIFKTIGISGLSASLLLTGVFGLIKGVFCFIWAFFVIERFGRRVPIILFSSICVFCLFYIGAYIKIADPEHTLHGNATAGSKSALAFFYIWTASYALSLSGFPWIYMSEVFDSKVRNLAQSINASANWLIAFIFARWSQNMIDSMNYGIFFFFASLLFICIIIFSLVYPETKNIPIHDIDLLFEKDVPAWKAHARAIEIIRTREMNNQINNHKINKSAINDPYDKPNGTYLEVGNSAGSSSKLV